MAPLLEMRNIGKTFPGVKALDNVSFTLERGETHVLMGENGAGKSTLMKILAGINTPDSGSILVDGKEVVINSPRDAVKEEISMIHQELSPIPAMTLAENIFVGREPTNKFGILDRKTLAKQTAELFARLGVKFKPFSIMGEHSVAEQQMVEIAKAISYNSKIIIMDEPTSAITENEAEKLFQIIDYLKKQGVSIIYISHKMDEIFRLADRITILRDGCHIATRNAADLDNDELIKLMVGREVKDVFPKVQVEIGKELLRVENLSLDGKFRNVSFTLRAGEILGFAGLMGAGRTEVVETLFGIRNKTSGKVYMDGEDVSISKPIHAIKHGIALVPEDRKQVGLILKSTVNDNISLVSLNDFCKFGVVRKQSERVAVNEKITSIRIRTPSPNQLVNNLSGGNQQKVVISKWLLSNPKILILDEPTRGIDVGSKAEIYGLVGELVKNGMGVIMISSELPEVIGLSDRVVVMHEGVFCGILDRGELSQEAIMACALSHGQSRRTTAATA